MVTDEIKQSIANVVGIKPEEVDLSVPQVEEHGDYSTNIAMDLYSDVSRKNLRDFVARFSLDDISSPRELAEQIVQKLKKDNKLQTLVSKIEVAGPGFINFFLSEDVLKDVLYEVESKGESFGKSKNNEGKKVIVEYSSPNIAKPFTIGHLRSTVIGDAISNLLEATGWEVMRDNHIGDWGTQFGKQIYAIKAWGDEKEIENSDNPVKELVDLYVKFHKEAEEDPSIEDEARKWFKKLEDGDEEARMIWRKCIEWSWQEFEKLYRYLNIRFSDKFNGGRGLGESFFEDKMDEVINELADKGLLKEGKEGAKLVFFEDEEYPPAMILKKDGATLYHTRDLATDKYRKKMYDPDLIINEVGAEQKLYFEQLFEMEKLLGWYKDGERIHVYHGMFRFKDKKMSTRKGNVIWMQDIIDQAVKLAKKMGSATEELANDVGIGAIKYNDLKRDPKGDIIFDWDEVLNMQGNSGPYLQYTHARTQSVLEKAGDNVDFEQINDEMNEEERSIAVHLSRFPGVVLDASKSYSPNTVANYLYELAQKYNAFYNKHQIVGSEQENLRVLLTKATGQVLKNGLNLLGIKVPDKM